MLFRREKDIFIFSPGRGASYSSGRKKRSRLSTGSFAQEKFCSLPCDVGCCSPGRLVWIAYKRNAVSPAKIVDGVPGCCRVVKLQIRAAPYDLLDVEVGACAEGADQGLDRAVQELPICFEVMAFLLCCTHCSTQGLIVCEVQICSPPFEFYHYCQ